MISLLGVADGWDLRKRGSIPVLLCIQHTQSQDTAPYIPSLFVAVVSENHRNFLTVLGRRIKELLAFSMHSDSHARL
jgi:hypothetical protein